MTAEPLTTYGGWTVVTMPTTPSFKNVEFTTNQIVGTVVSPFTGQEQLLDWNSGWMEASLDLPPLTQDQATAWIAFLVACKGPLCVFQLPPLLAALVPSGVAPAGYWRLKDNANKWSIQPLPLYGLHFNIREAL